METAAQKHFPHEANAFVDFQLPYEPLKFSAAWAVTNDDEVEARIEPGQGTEQQFVILHRRQTGDYADRERAFRQIPLPPPGSTRRRHRLVESRVLEKVRNLDNLVSRHPFARKQFCAGSTVRQNSMSKHAA